MKIQVECPGCFQSYSVKSELAGKRIRCKECQTPITVPRRSGGRDGDDDEFEVEPAAAPRPSVRSAKSEPRRRKGRASSGRSPYVTVMIVAAVAGLLLIAGPLLFRALAIVCVPLLLLGGVVATLFGGFGCLVTAFREDPLVGVMYLFVPFYAPYFVISRWEETGKLVGTWALGVVLLAAGGWIMSRGFATGPAPAPDAQQAQGGAAPTAADAYPLPAISPPDPGDYTAWWTGDDGRSFSFDSWSVLSERIPRKLIELWTPPESAGRRYPCVIIVSEPRNMVSGQFLPPPRHIPNPVDAEYIKAGFAVIRCSLDGWTASEKPTLSDDTLAYTMFATSAAGVGNLEVAFQAVSNFPSVIDPNRIFVYGRGTGSRVALLYAAHQPKLAGCIAVSPVVDAAFAHGKTGGRSLLPGLDEFLRRSSPATHAARCRCPMLIMPKAGDNLSTPESVQSYVKAVTGAGNAVEVTAELAGGGDTELATIAPAIAWMKKAPSKTNAPEPDPGTLPKPQPKPKTLEDEAKEGFLAEGDPLEMSFAGEWSPCTVHRVEERGIQVRELASKAISLIPFGRLRRPDEKDGKRVRPDTELTAGMEVEIFADGKWRSAGSRHNRRRLPAGDRIDPAGDRQDGSSRRDRNPGGHSLLSRARLSTLCSRRSTRGRSARLIVNDLNRLVARPAADGPPGHLVLHAMGLAARGTLHVDRHVHHLTW